MLSHTPVIFLRRLVIYDNHTQQVPADFPLATKLDRKSSVKENRIGNHKTKA